MHDLNGNNSREAEFVGLVGSLAQKQGENPYTFITIDGPNNRHYIRGTLDGSLNDKELERLKTLRREGKQIRVFGQYTPDLNVDSECQGNIVIERYEEA